MFSWVLPQAWKEIAGLASLIVLIRAFTGKSDHISLSIRLDLEI